MKTKLLLLIFMSTAVISSSTAATSTAPVLKLPAGPDGVKVLYLHHSTGMNIWKGGLEASLQELRDGRNDVQLVDQAFPKKAPYGWNNYPYDYWKIWVENAGEAPFMQEPTLEMITKHYDVVVFKHCYPVSKVLEDDGAGDVSSSVKNLANYKLQYEALKKKLHEFPQTKFLVWTSAALVEAVTTQEEGLRSKAFVDWVKNEWDEPGDNIFLWDFHALETEGGLFLKDAYAVGPRDPHPNPEFASRAAKLLAKRLDDVLRGEGDSTNICGR